MTIKYYKNSDLAYANRKRRRDISSYTADATETNNSVKLGDGGTTTIITSSSNICNYVTITVNPESENPETSRWYVTSYTYLNGGQIELNLRRDVIGEFGLDGYVGKIERGYTESFLRNRKELDLNQRLINRIPLKSTSNKYGNYTVSTHDDEMWGVIYLTKPTELDPKTGLPYSDTPSINIPAFSPNILNYTYISQDKKYTSDIGYTRNPIGIYYMKIISSQSGTKYYRILYTYSYVRYNNKWVCQNWAYDEIDEQYAYDYITITTNSSASTVLAKIRLRMNDELENNKDLYKNSLPIISSDNPVQDYDGVVIKYDDDDDESTPDILIQYSVNKTWFMPSGSVYDLHNLSLITATLQNTSEVISYNTTGSDFVYNYFETIAEESTYHYEELTPEQAGNLVLDITQQLIDEPYICYVFPLYNVTITGPSGYNKTIDRDTAFMVFNTVIQYCSGENSYLVDAQIYPYCPELTNIGASINNYPFFNIQSSAFYTSVDVQLKPYVDIKKEYIKKEYCLISPDQSGSYKFNYYDFSNDIIENNIDSIYNDDIINIIIKTALKPMNIISSAVIIPHVDALVGITYDSDLRGCQTTSNGFEFSLSTNKFQEYVRNNSNYQAIFSLQREELQKQHQVEKVNEQSSVAINTLTATMMGAIGGASLADYSYFGSSAKGAGAAIGAATAGSIVGGVMGKQLTENNKLREYEEYLQQQNFNLQVGTIKNIPNQVSRISSFNEIIMRNFYYVIEVYECSSAEGEIVDKFIEKYGYGLGIIGEYDNFKKNNWFLRGTLITSNLIPILHNIAQKELMGGIYYIYE